MYLHFFDNLDILDIYPKYIHFRSNVDPQNIHHKSTTDLLVAPSKMLHLIFLCNSVPHYVVIGKIKVLVKFRTILEITTLTILIFKKKILINIEYYGRVLLKILIENLKVF